VINIVPDSWVGGLGIGAGYGLLSPFRSGIALAMLGLISVAPRNARSTVK
jgi:hypothetical protein